MLVGPLVAVVDGLGGVGWRRFRSSRRPSRTSRIRKLQGSPATPGRALTAHDHRGRRHGRVGATAPAGHPIVDLHGRMTGLGVIH